MANGMSTDDDLAGLLAQEDFLPPQALRRAVENPEAIAAATLEVLEAAAQDPDAPSDQDVNLLFWGVHALAAGRDARVFAPLLRLLRQDAEALEGILGDALARTLPRVLASTYDGDADAFERFLLDTTLDDEVRYAAFQALAFLTRDARFERARTEQLLLRFDTAGISVENGLGWVGWAEAVAYLGLATLGPRVEAAFRDRRIGEEFIDAAWFRQTLRQISATPRDESAFEGLPYGYLDDPVAALDWTAETYGQPMRNPFKDVGRNDPCPCGSGRKFKKCCLNAAATADALTPPMPGAR